MDRDKVTKASAQVGFIGFVMVPLFEALSKLLPGIEEPVVQPIKKSLDYYKEVDALLMHMFVFMMFVDGMVASKTGDCFVLIVKVVRSGKRNKTYFFYSY